MTSREWSIKELLSRIPRVAELSQSTFAIALRRLGLSGPSGLVLEEEGVGELARVAGQPEADPLDLLCHLAFSGPLRTRRERAQRLRSDRKHFFDHYGPEARQVLDELLDKYTEHGTAAATRRRSSA